MKYKEEKLERHWITRCYEGGWNGSTQDLVRIVKDTIQNIQEYKLICPNCYSNLYGVK